MDSVQLVIDLCKEKGIAIAKLERDCGFSNGYIRKLKEGKFPSDRLQIIADYLGVSNDYLMTGEKKDYYFNEEAAQMAQEIFEDKYLRSLFDTARNNSPEDLKLAEEFLKRLKGTNPDA